MHYHFPEKTFFNLDVESNLPTIYQGAKTFLVAFFSLFLFLFAKGRVKYFWIFFTFVFFFLALDEIGQIHENLPTFWQEIFVKEGERDLQDIVSEFGYESAVWLPYYTIPFLFFFAVVGIFLKDFIKENWRKALVLAVGSIFLVLVLVLEYMGTKPDIMFQEEYEKFVFWEEAFELLAITFLLFFSYTYLVEKLRGLKVFS